MIYYKFPQIAKQKNLAETKSHSKYFKNKEFSFSESNINAAIIALRELPIQDGFIKANQVFFDLITLGKPPALPGVI